MKASQRTHQRHPQPADDDRFVTSYQNSFCGNSQARPHTAEGPRGRTQTSLNRKSTQPLLYKKQSSQTGGTPQKGAAVIQSLTNPRKFGEYEPTHTAKSQAPVSYETGKRTRCTDRFVRYPYPKQLFSAYKQTYHGARLHQAEVKNHKDAFNLEKETKIINPHKMDLATTSKSDFKGHRGERARARRQPPTKEDKPISGLSSYQAAFPNWENGKKDVFHERHPQYPFYSLPFRGSSSYKQSFVGDKI